MKYYKNNGFQSSFYFPLLGEVYLRKKNLSKNGDELYYRRIISEHFPNTKGIVTNMLDKVFLIN